MYYALAFRKRGPREHHYTMANCRNAFLDGFRVLERFIRLPGAINWGKPIKEGLVQFRCLGRRRLSCSIGRASQPRVTWLASLLPVEEEKELLSADQAGGKPGGGANRAESSVTTAYNADSECPKLSNPSLEVQSN